MVAPATPPGTAGNTLLYQATIDDLTQAFFTKFDKNITVLSAKANQGFGNVNNGANSSNASLTKLAAVFGLTASISTMFFNTLAKGVRDFENLISEGVQAAAQYDRLGTTMYVLGANLGYTKKQMDEFQKGVESQNVSMSGARQALIRMVQSDIDLTKAQALANLAADASVITNTSVAQSMDRIVRSIQVLQPRFLRTMGIYIDVRKENERYAAANDTTVDKLDETTKRHIFLNAVLEKAKTVQGAYAESLKTAAGQQQLAQMQTDNLKVSIGELAQPALIAWLKTWNDLLSKALKWLTDNKDQLTVLASEVGGEAARTFKDFANTVEWLFHQLSEVLNLFGHWGNAIAGIEEPPGIKKTTNDLTALNNVVEAYIKLAGIVRGAWGYCLSVIGTEIEILSIRWEHFKAVFSGDFVKMAETAAKLTDDSLAKMRSDAWNEGLDRYDAALVETAKQLEDAKNAQTDLANAPLFPSDAQVAALDDLEQSLQDLHDKLEEQAAQAAIQKTRDAIENALKDAWQQEDMARDLADKINDIEANGQDEKLKLVQDYAEKRWKIEKDYTDALRKLKENFEFDSNEAARKRDAVELLALARKYAKDLKDLKDNKKDQTEEAKKNYEKAVKDLDDSLQKQIKKAQEAYKRQEEELVRSKRREMVIQQLHDQWAAEDLKRQTEKQLKTLIDQYKALDTATKDGLTTVLNDWAWYFTSLNAMINTNASSVPGVYPQSNVPGIKPGTRPSSPTSIGGQAGQVTGFLTPSGITRPAALDTVPVTRLPLIQAQNGISRKEMDIKVSGNGLSPYIQRQLIMMLAEIERNAA